MKIIILILTTIILSGSVKSNPIVSPQFVNISELYFDANGKWFLEVNYYLYNNLDSMVVTTSTGKSKIKPLHFNFVEGYSVITIDSLYNSLAINRDGDFVKLYYYLSNTIEPDSFDILIFGDYDKSVIGKPVNGQSLARMGFKTDNRNFSKCISPTLGEYNSNLGIGTLYGVLYNSNGIPLANKKCSIGHEFTTGADGKFSTSVYAKRYKLDSIYVYEPHYSGINEYNKNTPLQFDVEPGETITRNIFFTSTWVSVREYPVDIMEDLVKFSPNPVGLGEDMIFRTFLPVFSSECSIEILDVRGIVYKSVKMDNYQGVFTVPVNLKSKIFLLCVKMNGKVVQTTRIISKS